MKVLLADDSPTIQKVIRLCFADEPLQLEVASDGQQTMELLHSWKPDVLLVDALLPGMDGYEICTRVKRDIKIPVVLLVGAFEPFDFGRAEDSRYDAYLTKPFDTASLVRLVKELGSRADPAPAPETS